MLLAIFLYIYIYIQTTLKDKTISTIMRPFSCAMFFTRCRSKLNIYTQHSIYTRAKTSDCHVLSRITKTTEPENVTRPSEIRAAPEDASSPETFRPPAVVLMAADSPSSASTLSSPYSLRLVFLHTHIHLPSLFFFFIRPLYFDSRGAVSRPPKSPVTYWLSAYIAVT